MIYLIRCVLHIYRCISGHFYKLELYEDINSKIILQNNNVNIVIIPFTD